jgi:hypothetical protein
MGEASAPSQYLSQHISLNYRNYHAQTALHELVDNHVFLTSVRCKWHSDPNFWGEMEWKRFVWCASQTCWCQSSQVFGRVCLCIRHECTECQACGGSLAWMLYWNNGSAQSTVFQVALLAKQAYSRTFFVATKIGEQLAWWKWWLTNNKVFRCCQHQDNQQDLHKDYIGNNSWDGGDWLPWSAFPPSSCSASRRGIHSACAVGVCSSSAQCKDEEASEKNGLAPWKLPTPLS